MKNMKILFEHTAYNHYHLLYFLPDLINPNRYVNAQNYIRIYFSKIDIINSVQAQPN